MKKIYALACLSLVVVLPGCWRGKGKSSTEEAVSTGMVDTDKRTSIFDENEEAFVLEDSKNPFNPGDESVNLVEDSSLWDRQQGEFETVYFEFNKYQPKADQTAAIDRLAVKIKETPAGTIIVEGHACDSAGDPDYNMMLSERRARQIKKMLVSRGIPASRLKVVGRGSQMRKVQGGNRDQQAPNRRVELYTMN